MIDVSPLREFRSFRLVWFGQLISLTGTQLRLVAIPYQIYLLTGSSLDVGLIGLFQAIPLISLALFGGVIADSVDRRSDRHADRPRRLFGRARDRHPGRHRERSFSLRPDSDWRGVLRDRRPRSRRVGTESGRTRAPR